MTQFPLQTAETAQPAAAEILEAAARQNGFVPNLYATLANAPLALEAYTTLGATVSYMRSRWGLRVNFRNITGTEYETRGFGSASAIPARPFEARARLEFGFGER